MSFPLALDGLEEHQGCTCRVLSEMGSGGEVQDLQVTGVSLVTYTLLIQIYTSKVSLSSFRAARAYKNAIGTFCSDV